MMMFNLVMMVFCVGVFIGSVIAVVEKNRAKTGITVFISHAFTTDGLLHLAAFPGVAVAFSRRSYLNDADVCAVSGRSS